MADVQKSGEIEGRASSSLTSYGPYVGTIFGLFVGLFISGPNFHFWAITQILGVIVGFAIVGCFAGFCIRQMASSYTSSVYGGAEGFGDGDFGESHRFDGVDHGSHHSGDSIGDFGGGHDG